MTTVLNGVLGGLLVGFVAALATRLVAGGPSATARALESAVDAGVASSRWAGFAVGTLYGGLAGGLLVALELLVLRVLAVPPTTVEAVGVAVAWSALLLGTASVVRRVASSPSHERSRPGELLVYHLVYGVGLGLWIRMTWIT